MYALQQQRQLQLLGFYSGPLDGRAGPLTKEATLRFQQANGLKSDGIFGPETEAKTIELIREVQEKINQTKSLGLSLKADGKAGPETLEAVKLYQASQKLKIDGVLGAKTIGALKLNGKQFTELFKRVFNSKKG